MPQVCSICSHPQRTAIDKAIIAGQSNRSIAKQYGVSDSAVLRHRREHVPEILARAAAQAQPKRIHAKRSGEPTHAAALVAAVHQQQAAEEAHAVDLLGELMRQLERANLLSDACDRYLRDPADQTRYDIGPRAGDVIVTYLAPVADRWVPRKASLAALLAQIQEAGLPVEKAEFRVTDPRKLVLDAAAQLGSTVQLITSLLEKVNNAQEVEAFRTAVLEAIGEVAPDVREAIERNLRRRKPVLLARRRS